MHQLHGLSSRQTSSLCYQHLLVVVAHLDCTALPAWWKFAAGFGAQAGQQISEGWCGNQLSIPTASEEPSILCACREGRRGKSFKFYIIYTSKVVELYRLTMWRTNNKVIYQNSKNNLYWLTVNSLNKENDKNTFSTSKGYSWQVRSNRDLIHSKPKTTWLCFNNCIDHLLQSAARYQGL
jgi:hypothetical protein